MRKDKILFVYNLEPDSPYAIESIWAKRLNENEYVVDNIPFYIKNIALNDIVSVEHSQEGLYFESLVRASGDSVIRILVIDEGQIEKIGLELEKFGCTWESFKSLIAVDIPLGVDYGGVVLPYLKEGEDRGEWEYQEACLGFL